MRKREIQKMMDEARKAVNEEIRLNASRGGPFASALSSEGYAGGYRDALSDIQLLLNEVAPDRRTYWEFLRHP